VASIPTITSGSATSFTEGSTGSFTITTAGTPPPSLAETGALPAGVTFTSNGNGTATLGGTPAYGSAGSYPITVTAANGGAADATSSFTLTVDPAGSGFRILTLTVPGADALVPYTATLSASGGNPSYKWSLVGGKLPTGLKLHSSGSITGKPRLGGTSTFTLQVIDHKTKTRASFVRTLTYTLVVAQPVPSVAALKPATGSSSGGNQVSITGAALEGASVWFGPNLATIVSQSNTGTKVTVTAPVGSAGTVDVMVITPGGTSPLGPSDKYTYTGP
jgi:hypothetical protein